MWEVAERDAQGNVCRGDVIADNCRGSYFRSDSRLIAATGVDNLVVVETTDAILVADRGKVQDVKRIVNLLKQHRTVANRSKLDDSVTTTEAGERVTHDADPLHGYLRNSRERVANARLSGECVKTAKQQCCMRKKQRVNRTPL